MVDAVITWVDGNDPAHAAKREYYLARENPSHFSFNGGHASRWVDCGEIWYCITLLRQNAPWIGRIHLVTDNQRPKWLDISVMRELDVSVVDHKSIFAGMADCLPTFSSSSIETVLHKIPGLSEEFLYLNDDFFILRPIRYEDYFARGRVIPRGRLAWRGARFRRLLPRSLADSEFGCCAYRGGRRNTVSFTRLFSLAHAPYPLLKSELRKLFDADFIQRNACFRFKHNDQLRPYDLFYNQCIKHGRARPGFDDWLYLFPSRLNYAELVKKVRYIRRTKMSTTLCVQSLDQAEQSKRHVIFELLKHFHASTSPRLSYSNKASLGCSLA